MAKVYGQTYFRDRIIRTEDAKLSVASSAVLYGLSVYTVFPVIATKNGHAAFRLEDHYLRLVNSAKIIGINTFEPEWNYEKFKHAVKELADANNLTETVFVRATVHVSALTPGTRSRGLETALSMFASEAKPILPPTGARVKTTVWRRVPDYAIPCRAKVNGAYVNSVLGKQDALDAGYDDCLFVDAQGHACELSAANIFIVRNGTLITPGSSSDILEGITRKTILELAKEINVPAEERTIDLTEIYVADEAFACGTSSFIASISEIDGREIGSGAHPLTETIRKGYNLILEGKGAGGAKHIASLN